MKKNEKLPDQAATGEENSELFDQVSTAEEVNEVDGQPIYHANEEEGEG